MPKDVFLLMLGTAFGWLAAAWYADEARRQSDRAHAQAMGMWRLALGVVERHFGVKFSRDAEGNPTGEIVEAVGRATVQLRVIDTASVERIDGPLPAEQAREAPGGSTPESTPRTGV